MPRIKRQAQNQLLFRQVNEKIAEVSSRFDSGRQAFVCECAHTGCATPIPVPLEVYDRIRRTPGFFVVAKGHQEPGDEIVVEDHGKFLIVQTSLEDTGEIAVAPPDERAVG